MGRGSHNFLGIKIDWTLPLVILALSKIVAACTNM